VVLEGQIGAADPHQAVVLVVLYLRVADRDVVGGFHVEDLDAVAAVAVDVPAVDEDVARLVGAEGARTGGTDEGDVAAARGAGDVPVLEVVDDHVLTARRLEGDTGSSDRGPVRTDLDVP